MSLKPFRQGDLIGRVLAYWAIVFFGAVFSATYDELTVCSDKSKSSKRPW
jgi:hypothetical protein